MEQNLNQDQNIVEMEQSAEQVTEVTTPVTSAKLYAKIRNIVLSMFALVFVTVMFYSASTYSFYSDGASSAPNKISAGSLDMEIVEMSSQGGVEHPFESPVRIVPSIKVSKIVKIKNTGTLPIYVRVKIDISIDKDEATLPENWRSLISFNFNLDNEETGSASAWELRNDGYYYYKAPVSAGSTTTALPVTVTERALQQGAEDPTANGKYSLTVVYVATGVQVSPSNAVEDAWGVTLNETEISSVG